MSFGNNKVLKVTWWLSRSATSGNWTCNWFGGGEDCSSTLTVWELLSGSLEQVVSRDSLSGGTSKGALVFGGLTAGLGRMRLSDRCLFRHVDGLRIAPSVCWLLTVSEVSSISPEDLSILSPDFI